jgi:hypothetical protein
MAEEIKATAATWEDIKRLSEENERLKSEIAIAKCLLSNEWPAHYRDMNLVISELLESKTND